jgi:septal ring factor EnvC (AmiA/AmiB activator)
VSRTKARRQAGNRKLINFFKFVIVSVLAVPWIIAGAIGLSLFYSQSNHSQDLRSFQRDIESLEADRDEIQEQLDKTTNELAAITEAYDELQQSVLADTTTPREDNDDYYYLVSENGQNGQNEQYEQANTGTQGYSSLNREQIEELALEVIVGNWDNGINRVRKLEDAGYHHGTIQRRVNEIIWEK